MHTQIINFKNSSIVLGRDLVDTNLIVEACKTQVATIVCDHHIAELYGEKLLRLLQKSSVEAHLFTFTPGEASKCRANKEAIEDQMLSQGLGRDTTVIGIGGGVTTDLSGFIAATYCRGVPFISVPTSLLGMVDAALGGKTGVNTPYGKNLVGAFYLPESVVIDFGLLKTLPQKEIKEGLVELIKTALIYDEKLFMQLITYYKNGMPLDSQLEEMIHRCCQIKLEVVKQDFEEKSGIRRILNFGHTVGHALERFFDYQMSHGEAVAIGMIAEGFMSCELEILPRHDFHEMTEFLLPFTKQTSFDVNQVIDLMILDKKSKDKTARFVMLEGIGKVHDCSSEYCMPIEIDVVRNALKFIQEIGNK
ncbi:MAG: 3-dehydroquinate synthase [Chlamydiae bacterium]|nr:3-dehydroquinate synthase [Chlamydiota bacterium]